MHLSSFDLLESRHIDLLNGTARLYRHQSGAQVLSIVNDDENKVFGVTFPTPPTDSTGVQHIIEHSVLCGSNRYPVKEPFKELLKNSLQTFLNAMTYPDYTTYPVASCNDKDFYNLTDVYLDAVFHPRISDQMLGQEGWHCEESSEGGLEIQGVVYNEMKGVYSTPEAHAYHALHEAIFPDTANHFDSGGRPADIRTLTYDTFLTYYRQHYHPGNAFIYFYGDNEESERLRRIDEVLQKLESGQAAQAVDFQAPWSARRVIERNYPAGEHQAGEHFVVLNWLLGETGDPEEDLLRSFVGDLLFSNPASPLRDHLMKSGLGEDLFASGPSGSRNQAAFSAGLRGVAAESIEEVVTSIETGLRAIVAGGFSPELIEGAFNSQEFRMREQNSGGTPRGLLTMLRVLPQWMNGQAPLALLEVDKRIASLKKQHEETPSLFTDWIRTSLLDNPSTSLLIVRPDVHQAEREQSEERAYLEALEANLNEEQRQALRDRQEDIERYQTREDTPEELATLPSLSLSDVQQSINHDECIHVVDDRPVFHTPLASRGILYVCFSFDLAGLSPDQLSLLPLYTRCLTELGTQSLDLVGFNEELARHTGGLSATFFTGEHVANNSTTARLLLRCKCLASKVEETRDLLQDLLLSPRFNATERLQQFLLEDRAAEEAHIVPAGNRVVGARLAARYAVSDNIDQSLDGIRYLDDLRLLAARNLDEHEKTCQALQNVHKQLVAQSSTELYLAGDEGLLQTYTPAFVGVLDQLPVGERGDRLFSIGLAKDIPEQEGLAIPGPIHFVGLSAKSNERPDFHGSVLVAQRQINTDYLWEQVRMQGGAYGCHLSYRRTAGAWFYASYRDPHVTRTLDIYRSAADWLHRHAASGSALEQCLIGTLGSVMPVRSASGRAYDAIVRRWTGVNRSVRLKMHEEIRGTSQEHIRQWADTLNAALHENEALCILGNGDSLQSLSTLSVRDVL